MEPLVHRWEARQARKGERLALWMLGESLPQSAEVAVVDEKIGALSKMLAVSMARDRADFAAVPAWARPLVILRGLFDRGVLRALRRRARSARIEACVKLGAGSLDSAKGDLADSARAMHQRRLDAEARLRPLPLVAREAQHFANSVWTEGRNLLWPRAPALIGLAVGFWIAQTFTDSTFSATLHTWGIGSGPTRAVSSGTLRTMSWVLPVLAAAVASYAGSRLAALIRTRYAPPADEPPQ
jgi:hypothetical protein